MKQQVLKKFEIFKIAARLWHFTVSGLYIDYLLFIIFTTTFLVLKMFENIYHLKIILLVYVYFQESLSHSLI